VQSHSESDSDDAWKASVTDAALQKQMTKKYNKLSPYGKMQSALELSLPTPMPTEPGLSRRQD